jgi:AAHS family 4-hydroxybenzoate transporter-like MFS transporter
MSRQGFDSRIVELFRGPSAPTGPLTVLALCLAIVTFDGFDAQVMSYISPQLLVHWKIDRTTLAPALSAGLFGLMLGAPLFGTLGDRIGRKAVLIVSTLWFALFALLTVLATSVVQMVALRLLTGIGLGGSIPAAIALVSEFAPERYRATFATITVCGFAIGPAIEGLIAAPLIAAWGWQALFVVGGVAPLLLLPIVWRWLPEATVFTSPADAGETASSRPRFTALFLEHRVIGTPLLWCAIFLNLAALNLVLAWLPIVISDLGFSYAQATSATAMFHIGGVFGGLALGTLVDRFGYYRVTTLTLLAASACVVAIGYSGGSIEALRFAILLAGGFVVGAQALLNSLSGMYYPLAMRATGSGWALGVGRLGATVGPLLGGLLMTGAIEHAALFYVEGIPLYFAALACAALASRAGPASRERALVGA